MSTPNARNAERLQTAGPGLMLATIASAAVRRRHDCAPAGESPITQGDPTVQNPGKVIASYPDYAAAQHAVDALADQRFPVGGLAIVGANLRSYEQITGRRGYVRAAAEGFTSGA